MNTLPVIAAVDGSDNSLRALDWAVDAARGRGAPLRVVHVRQHGGWTQPGVPLAPVPDSDDDTVIGEVRRHLDDVADRPVMEYLALEGAPAAVLPELGATAQLLVLGSRGRGGFASLLLGSNGVAASRDADCPVVVVPPPGREVHGEGQDEPGRRVVVGVKVDEPDEPTLSFAFAEAARLGARVQAIAAYTWPVQTVVAPGGLLPPTVDQDAIENETRTLAEGILAPYRERHPGVRADAVAAPGDAAGQLVAASADAALVVVGRHRRRLLAPARLLGSVTQAVLLHAASPIAVVPQTPEPAEE
ncbi:universal stress protein [Streptomyces griseoviridis]|uniref:universal stress protein n=1 Tax=Streptomyces griseoviridis TaxID=45398 RepID=UPI0034475AC6